MAQRLKQEKRLWLRVWLGDPGFYLGGCAPQRNGVTDWWRKWPVVLESCRSFFFWVGGGANPLHPPPRSTPVFNATYRTGLHGNYDYGLWNSRYNISTGHAHSILIFEKRRNCFWKPVNFDHKCDWQLNKRMCQSLVEVSILPHFFSRCDRPLLAGIWSQKLHLPRDSQTQTHF